jgi:hypothetical protein
MKLNSRPGDKFYSTAKPASSIYLAYLASITLLIITIASIYRLYIIDFNIYEFFTITNPVAVTEFTATFILASMSSVIAAFLFAYIESVRSRSAVSSMFKYAPPEFYRDFLNNIYHYNGIIRYDHLVRVNIRPHPSRDDIYACDLTYTYRVSRAPRVLRFRIHRLIEIHDADSIPLLADECLDNDLNQ